MSKRAIITKDIGFLLLSSFLFFSAFNILLPTFPLHVSYLGGSDFIVGLLGGLFAFGAVLLRPYFGRLTDRLTRKKVLYIAAIISATGPLLYLPNWGFWFLGLARFYHAASLAAFITASQTMLADFSTSQNRGTLFGMYGIVSGAAMAVTPVLGLHLLEGYSGTILFLFTAIMASLALPATYMIDEPRAQSDQLDAAPAVGGSFQNRAVLVPSMALFCVTMAFGALNSFLPLHAAAAGIGQVGIFFTVFSVVSMIARVVCGPLSDKYGRAKIAAPAILLVSIGLGLLTSLSSVLTLVFSAILIGVGFSTAHTVLLAYLIDKVPSRMRSRAVSFFANAFDLGVSTGSMALGVIASLSYGLLWGILSGAVLLGFGAMISLLPKEQGMQGET